MNERAVLLLALALPTAGPTLAADSPEGELQADRTGDFEEWWEQARGSGHWRIEYFTSSKTLDDADGFLGAVAQLKLSPRLTDSLDAKLDFRVTQPAIGEGGELESRVLEAYAAMKFAKADLYLGKQIVAWGRADGLNPTDNLTPRDYTLLLPFEDDQRFGTAAAKLDWYLSDTDTITLFASPFFEPTQIPLPREARTLVKNEPAETASNTQVGLKFNRVREGLDWSVSYYRGFNLTPTLELSALSDDALAGELHYDRITVFGADIARNFGRFGLRGEIAYVDTADDRGVDPGVRNSHLFWIAGIDRTFYENLNINVQFFQRRIRNHRDPALLADPLQRSAALLNSIFDGQRDHVSDGVTFRVSNLWWNNTLEAEIFGLANLTQGDGFIRPLVTYAFDDHWTGTIGAELYRGDADTQYGSLKRNRTAFLEVRYGF